LHVEQQIVGRCAGIFRSYGFSLPGRKPLKSATTALLTFCPKSGKTGDAVNVPSRREYAIDRAEKEKTRTAPAGTNFMQRFRIWREERRCLAQLRWEKLRELEALSRQERLEEIAAIARTNTKTPEDKK
jgi:hypothetical protein